MPLYEYECQDCKEVFAELRSGAEMDDPIDCPGCGGSDTRKVLSRFAVGSARNDAQLPCGAPEGTTCGGGSCPMR